MDEPVRVDLDPSEPDQPIPFTVRMTMEEVLHVADEAVLRSQMLQWFVGRDHAEVLHRAGRLHESAIDLQQIAADLEDGWTDPTGSS